MKYFVTTEPVPALGDLCVLRFAKVVDDQVITMAGDELQDMVDRLNQAGVSGLPKQSPQFFDASHVDKGFVVIGPRDCLGFHHSLWFFDADSMLINFVDEFSDVPKTLHVHNLYFAGPRIITEFEYVEKEKNTKEE